jgi:hypothetical protein
MYRLLAIAFMVVTAPLWVPVAVYLACTMHWTDTVPSEEDLK